MNLEVPNITDVSKEEPDEVEDYKDMLEDTDMEFGEEGETALISNLEKMGALEEKIAELEKRLDTLTKIINAMLEKPPCT